MRPCLALTKTLQNPCEGPQRYYIHLNFYSSRTQDSILSVRNIGYLCDEVRMANDGSDKEAIICDFCPLFHASSTQVQLHPVMGAGNGSQVKVTHTIQLKLEGQSRLQVTVDSVFMELRGRVRGKCSAVTLQYKFLNYKINRLITYFVSGPKCEVLWELPLRGTKGTGTVQFQCLLIDDIFRQLQSFMYMIIHLLCN